MYVIIIILKSPCSRWTPFFSIEKSQNILYGFPGKFYEKMSKIILFVIYRELVMWLRGDFLHEWIFTRDIVLGHYLKKPCWTRIRCDHHFWQIIISIDRSSTKFYESGGKFR